MQAGFNGLAACSSGGRAPLGQRGGREPGGGQGGGDEQNGAKRRVGHGFPPIRCCLGRPPLSGRLAGGGVVCGPWAMARPGKGLGCLARLLSMNLAIDPMVLFWRTMFLRDTLDVTDCPPPMLILDGPMTVSAEVRWAARRGAVRTNVSLAPEYRRFLSGFGIRALKNP